MVVFVYSGVMKPHV